MIFIKKPNEKRRTIKFDFQISLRKIAIHLMLYKDENNFALQT